MPEAYVTLFDSLFLPQGLALHASMERHIRDYVLWILCVDDESYDVLGRIDLPNVQRLKLSDLETPELLSVKSVRTPGEYCWTLTPFAPKFVFEADPKIDRVTYIDADLWFLKNPKSIFIEFEASSKHVLITDHAYSPEYDQSFISGQYCVQFMTFTRHEGEHVRQWWEDRCIEWCFARFEDGKFGDQKYLDDWPERFGDLVHVLQDIQLTLAPWNASRFPYNRGVFFHFHALRLTAKNSVDISNYFIPKSLYDHVYIPYLGDLSHALDQLSSLGYCFRPQAVSVGFFHRVVRKLKLFKQKIAPLISPSEFRF